MANDSSNIPANQEEQINSNPWKVLTDAFEPNKPGKPKMSYSFNSNENSVTVTRGFKQNKYKLSDLNLKNIEILVNYYTENPVISHTLGNSHAEHCSAYISSFYNYAPDGLISAWLNSVDRTEQQNLFDFVLQNGNSQSISILLNAARGFQLNPNNPIHKQAFERVLTNGKAQNISLFLNVARGFQLNPNNPIHKQAFERVLTNGDAQDISLFLNAAKDFQLNPNNQIHKQAFERVLTNGNSQSISMLLNAARGFQLNPNNPIHKQAFETVLTNGNAQDISLFLNAAKSFQLDSNNPIHKQAFETVLTNGKVQNISLFLNAAKGFQLNPNNPIHKQVFERVLTNGNAQEISLFLNAARGFQLDSNNPIHQKSIITILESSTSLSFALAIVSSDNNKTSIFDTLQNLPNRNIILKRFKQNIHMISNDRLKGSLLSFIDSLENNNTQTAVNNSLLTTRKYYAGIPLNNLASTATPRANDFSTRLEIMPTIASADNNSRTRDAERVMPRSNVLQARLRTAVENDVTIPQTNAFAILSTLPESDVTQSINATKNKKKKKASTDDKFIGTAMATKQEEQVNSQLQASEQPDLRILTTDIAPIQSHKIAKLKPARRQSSDNAFWTKVETSFKAPPLCNIL